VELGDDTKYAMKGEGNIFFHLDSSGSFNVKDVLYVSGFRKNFLSILVMEDWGFFITFQRGKVLMHPDGAIPDIAVVIGVREGNLSRLACKLVKDLVHDIDSLCELWNRRLRHLLYKVLLILREIVTSLPNFSVE
jgi:hypothetical protein